MHLILHYWHSCSWMRTEENTTGEANSDHYQDIVIVTPAVNWKTFLWPRKPNSEYLIQLLLRWNLQVKTEQRLWDLTYRWSQRSLPCINHKGSLQHLNTFLSLVHKQLELFRVIGVGDRNNPDNCTVRTATISIFGKTCTQTSLEQGSLLKSTARAGPPGRHICFVL